MRNIDAAHARVDRSLTDAIAAIVAFHAALVWFSADELSELRVNRRLGDRAHQLLQYVVRLLGKDAQ